MNNVCFVVMPIGTQNIGGLTITEDQLKKKYDYIIKNAILNGIKNATLNQVNNIKFMLGDVSKTVDKIDFNFDTLIVDPPRKGLDKKTREFILKKLPNKIIYISCEPNTLIRDLKEFESIYEVCDFKIMDMFSYTYHVESFCVLERR